MDTTRNSTDGTVSGAVNLNAGVPPLLPPEQRVNFRRAGSKGGMWIVCAAAVVAVCGLLLGAGAIGFIYYLQSPERSMKELAAAMQRHERETVEKYVDAEALAESARGTAHDLIEQKMQRDDEHGNPFIMLLRPVAQRGMEDFVDELLTPVHLIRLLSGDRPEEVMKDSMHGFLRSDVNPWIDLFGNGGDEGTKRKAEMGKGLLPLLGDLLIDDAVQKAKRETPGKPSQLQVVSREYEGRDRYVVTMRDSDQADLTVSLVFIRHGLTVWRFSGISVIVPANNGALADVR